MKKVLISFICALTCIFTSCDHDNDLLLDSTNNELKLISREVYNPESNTLRATNNYDNMFLCSHYSTSMQVHTYYSHNGDKSNHYYDLTGPQNSITVNRINYPYDWQRFNCFKGDSYVSYRYISLNRYYSPSRNDHKLITQANSYSIPSDYNYDGLIGYIFPRQEIGTSPLMEYYSDTYKNSFYTLNDVVDLGTYKYMGTLGYVYPGKLLSRNKVPFSITINIKNTGYQFRGTEALFYLKTRERDTYYVSKYSLNIGGGGNITLPNTHAIVDMYIVIGSDTGDPYILHCLMEPDAPRHPQYPSRYTPLEFTRVNNGFNTIFNFTLKDT